MGARKQYFAMAVANRATLPGTVGQKTWCNDHS